MVDLKKLLIGFGLLSYWLSKFSWKVLETKNKWLKLSKAGKNDNIIQQLSKTCFLIEILRNEWAFVYSEIVVIRILGIIEKDFLILEIYNKPFFCNFNISKSYTIFIFFCYVKLSWKEEFVFWSLCASVLCENSVHVLFISSNWFGIFSTKFLRSDPGFLFDMLTSTQIIMLKFRRNNFVKKIVRNLQNRVHF